MTIGTVTLQYQRVTISILLVSIMCAELMIACLDWKSGHQLETMEGWVAMDKTIDSVENLLSE